VLGHDRQIDVSVGGDDRVIHRGSPRAFAMIDPPRESRDRIGAMGFPDPTRLETTFAADRELTRCARFWTGALHLGVGAQHYALEFDAGRFVRAAAVDRAPGPRDVQISAAPEEWEKLLAKLPKPFYQDPYGASLHHAVSLGGDSDTLFAYYGALRRVIEILREAHA
jgi:hypothetical protein